MLLRRKIGNFIFCVLLGAFVFLSGVAEAQYNFEKEKQSSYSAAEQVGFAYFKLTGVLDPDFRPWVKSTFEYSRAWPIEKSDMLQTEIPRLKKGYYRYIPGDRPIKVKVPVSLVPGEEGQFTAKFTIVDSPYFPFDLGDRWIAVIPQGLEMPLPFTPMPFIADILNGTPDRQSFMTVGFIPRFADSEAPFMLDGQEVWLMMAEVVSILIESDALPTPVWSYTTEAYRQRRKQPPNRP